MGAACSSDNAAVVNPGYQQNINTHQNEQVPANSSMREQRIASTPNLIQQPESDQAEKQDPESDQEREKEEEESVKEEEQESDKEEEQESDRETSDVDEDEALDGESEKEESQSVGEPDQGNVQKEDAPDEMPLVKMQKRRINNLPVQDQMAAALHGRLDVEYPNLSRIVRIFTSSTFTDTQVERNTLMETVYPKLKTYCQERGYDFQVVDMRWGVRDEATEDHMTSELCMRELAECQKLSTGPNFITFLGQKYGYRPFPPKISAVVFEKMLAATDSKTDTDLLTHWFVRDDNSIPAYYMLQPIKSRLPDYSNEEDLKRKKQARDKWWSDFEAMQVILRQAAEKVLTRTEKHSYYWSVTEEEITRGLLDANEPKKHCFWFRRNIEDLLDNAKSPKARFFMDISSSIDKEAMEFLNDLKEKKINSILPPENIKTYNVKWTENGIDTKISQEHQQYVNSLCEDFFSILTQMIQTGIEEKKYISTANALQLECLRHSVFAQNKCDSFYGRNDLLLEIRNHLTDNPESPLVICGQTGSGKTSLLAKTMEKIPEWMNKDCIIVGRFLGTSTDSSSVKKLLISLCGQLAQISGGKIGNLDTENIQELKEKLSSWLSKCSKKNRLFLFLDSLDQLDDSNDGRNMAWLPYPLPDNVSLVMSTLSDPIYSVLPNLQTKYSSITYLEVPVLAEDDVTTILKESLLSKMRRLNQEQFNQVTSVCKVSTPLLLKIVSGEAMSWKSYTPVTEGMLQSTVTEAINALFEKVERYHGNVLVRRVLAYITSAKTGLSENEIEDILSCDDEVLNDVYQYHTPPLRRLPPLLWVRIRFDLRDYLTDRGADGTQVITWYHRQFYQVATQRYLSDEKHRIALHSSLADYFLGKWFDKKKPYKDKKSVSAEANRLVPRQPLVLKEDDEQVIFNLRKMSELPYHLIHSHQLDQLKSQTLCNLMFLVEKIRALDFNSVMDDFDLAEKEGMLDKELKTMKSVLLRSKNAVSLDPYQVPIQLSSRIRSAGCKDMPFFKSLLLDCENPPFTCITSKQGFLEGSSGSLLQKFVGHEMNVDSIGVSDDATRIATASVDGKLKIWDAENGKEILDINHGELTPHAPTGFLFYKNNQILASVTMSEFIVWDLRNGSVIKRHTVSENIQNHPVPIGRLADSGWILVLRESLFIFKENTWEKVQVVKGLAPVVTDAHYHQRDFCGGLGNLAVLKRGGVGHFLIVDLANYVKDKSGLMKVEVLEKGEKADTTLIQTVLTPSGKIVCLIYEADKHQDNICSFKVYSLKTGKLLKSFSGFDMGFCVGYEVLRVRDGDHVMMTNFVATENNSVVRDIDVVDGQCKLAGRVTRLCNIMVPFDEFRFLSVSAPTPMVVDMNLLTIDDGAEEDVNEDNLVETTFGKQADVIEYIPNCTRYMLSGYKNTALQIWDSANLKMVRDIEISGYTTLSRMVNEEIAVTITHTDKVMVYDMKTPKSFGAQKDGLSGESAIVGKMTVSQGLVFLATKHGLEIRDVLKDKVVSKLETGDKGLATLIISPDGNRIIGSPVVTEKTDILYVFDVKTRTRLPDIKFKKQSCYLESCVLSWDGQYLILPVSAKSSCSIWDVETGSCREVPGYQDNSVCCFGVSRVTNSVVTGMNSGHISLIDINKLEFIRTFKVPHVSMVSKMKVSQDGQVVVCEGPSASQVRVFDLTTAQCIGNVTADNQILDFKFSLDNQFMFLQVGNVIGVVQLYLHRRKKEKSSNCITQALEQLKHEPAFYGEEMITADFANQ